MAGAAAIQLGEFYETGQPEERPGSPLGAKGRVPCYRLFEAGDGRGSSWPAARPASSSGCSSVIGRPDLVGDPRLPDPPWGLLDEGPSSSSPRSSRRSSPPGREPSGWRLLGEADIPAQPVQTRDEFLATSLAKANDLAITVEHPELGPVEMMGVPLVMEARRAGSGRRPRGLGSTTRRSARHPPRRSAWPAAGRRWPGSR